MEYNLSIKEENKAIIRAYRKLLRHAKPILKEGDTKVIKKAFNVAADAHREMRRKSGEPYIFHPITVAQICVEEIGLGTTSIVAALLHDVVEDTPITLNEIQKMFGRKVARIIDGLTKISGVFKNTEDKQAENIRKIVMTMSDDVRVILIKLADRLHNMRTLGSMPRHKQLSISSETLYIYSPLAHRLGLYSVKTEFEDLYLKYTDPEYYELINKKISENQSERITFIRKFIRPIQKQLRDKFFEFTIKGRSKSAYSIWKKMKSKNVSFDEVYDLFAIRIIIKSLRDDEKSMCWQVYSVVTDFYKPNPNRLRDWVTTPKANGYESLHTTVMSRSGKWVEVQIRTERMDDVAERGYAAHWKYKNNGKDSPKDRKEGLDMWMNRVRNMLHTEGNAKEFVEEFRTNLFQDEIFVFTPQGDLNVMPQSSTVLDFAYEVHTQIGHKCLGAKINHKHVPINHILSNGDQVDVLTSPNQKPSKEWLNVIVTSKARKHIRDFLNEEKRELAQKGKEILQKKLLQYNIQLTKNLENRVCNIFDEPSVKAVYERIGTGKIDIEKINSVVDVRKFFPKHILTKKAKALKIRLQSGEKFNNSELILGDESYSGIQYELSTCCMPIKDDEIVGIISPNKGVIIHRASCAKLVETISNFPHKAIKSSWSRHFSDASMARIKIWGKDRAYILIDLINIISKQNNAYIQTMKASTNQGYLEDTFELRVQSKQHVETIIKNLLEVKGILRVDRYDNVELEYL